MGKSCFFIGHRESGEEILPALLEVVERHISEYGVSEFIVGGHGGFDSLAARAVIAAKQRHPGVILTRLLSSHPAEREITLPPGFDGSLYPPGMERVPRRFAIDRANRYALGSCAHLIANLRHPGSSTARLLEAARRLEKKGLLTITLIEK